MEIKNEFIKKHLVAICAAFIIVVAFLPFVSIDVAGAVENISGIKAISAGGFFGIMMIICPVVLIAMNYIPHIEKYRALIAIIVPIVCVICVILSGVTAAESATAGGDALAAVPGMDIEMKASVGIGCILMILGSIASLVAGLLTYHKSAFDSAVNKAKAKISR